MKDTTYTDYWKGLEIAIAQVENESNAAYQGFLCYASLKGKQRGPERVAYLMHYDPKTVQFWFKTYKWLSRASGVDAQVWIKEQQEREQLTREDNERFAKENATIKAKVLSIARKQLEVADNLLASAELAGKLVETGHVITSEGKSVPTHTEIHMKAKISDIPRLLDSAVKNSRLVNELPTEILTPQFPKTGQLSKLTDEELEQMREDNNEVLIRHRVRPENDLVN